MRALERGARRAPAGAAHLGPAPVPAHLGQLAELVGVQQQLLERAAVAVDLLGPACTGLWAPSAGLACTGLWDRGPSTEHRPGLHRVLPWAPGSGTGHWPGLPMGSSLYLALSESSVL